MTTPAENGAGTLPFAGRIDELRTLGQLTRHCATRSWIVDLSGEPGVGKTRLLWEFVARARGHGMLVAYGQASERTRSARYAMVVDALSDHVETYGQIIENFSETVEGGREFLSAFPSIGSPAKRGETLSGANPVSEYYAARTFLEMCVRERGLLVLLDDAHWADPASLDLIEFLCRHRPRGPVLLVLAYRPMQAPSRLRVALNHAARLGTCTQLDLKPLRQEEIHSVLPEEAWPNRDVLAEQSSGIPVYLELCLQAHARYGGPVTADIELSQLPTAQTLRAELEQLPATARAVTRAAARTGETFGLDEVAAMADANLADVAAALGELVARDILRHDAARRYRFRHPLLRLVAQQRGTDVQFGRASGVPPPQAGSVPGDDLTKLTRRELQIAELVAGGHTNVQIADELSVSTKTVEAHLTRIFGKLGVTRRAGLARAVTRAGGDGSARGPAWPP